MAKKRILVVFTGGTIGSVAGDGLIDVDDSTKYLLINLYRKQPNALDVEFDSLEPFSVLSEKIIPEDWTALAKSIKQRDLADCAGIIVTHGTDTLPFTAAALSYCFRGLSIPMVLVAANAPLNESRSNGLMNFTDAVSFIINEKLPGVYVAFSNEKVKTQIHIGTRLRRAAPFTHGFFSEREVPLGFMKDGTFFYEEDNNPSLKTLRSFESRTPEPEPVFSGEVLYIRPYPGLNYDQFKSMSPAPRAILHDLYHSGTACTRDGSHSILNLIDWCRERGIDFYIAPMESPKPAVYSSTQALIDHGAIPLYDIAVEAALVKLMLVYGQELTGEEIRQMLNEEDLFFERMSKGK